MEGGDPDVGPLSKRPRLDPNAPPYTTSTYPPPPHQPVPRHPILPASASPPGPYPPPTLPALSPSYPSTHRPSPSSSVPPLDSRSLESRALPPPSPHPQRPSINGQAPVTLPPRSYSQDATYAPPPHGLPLHTAPPDQRRPPSGDLKPAPMDHGPPPMYVTQDHRPNGTMPNGYPMPSPQEQYAPPPSQNVAPNQQYPSVPGTPYGSGAQMYTPTPTQYQAQAQIRRKQVRATQACNNCRTRKQKCDEQRPCQFCRENGFDCAYKDVPPPKSDRTMMQILDSMQKVAEKVDVLASRVESLEHRFPRIEQDAMTAGSQQPSPSTASEQGPGLKHHRDTGMHSTGSTPASAHAVIHHLGAQQSRPVSPVFRQPAVPTRQDSIATPSIAAEREVESSNDVALPADHTTAAHQLFEIWPGSAMKEFFKLYGMGEEDKETTDYPLESEQRRGLLRVYGSGQGSDDNDGANGPSSPASNGDTPATPPQDGLWGTGIGNSPPMEIKRSDSATPSALTVEGYSPGNPGGLGPDGHLKLDSETVRSLHHSYLQHIDILHPLIDKGKLQKMIDHFIRCYSPDARSAFSPGSAVPNHVFGGMKRKRSSSGYDMHSPAESGYGYNSRILPERSISNAIVLLVLALGKVCQHKHVLPGPVGPGEMGNAMVEKTRGSPAASTMTADSPTNFYYTERDHRMSAEPPGDHPKVRNIDFLPGLAYYAYATDILGNLHGGNEISHAQAFLLAGLYMGQYARVMESWSWINTACRVCSILLKKDKKHLTLEAALNQQHTGSAERFSRNLLKCVYWACLQLESDILAEMSALPPSGISKYQGEIALPQGITSDMPTDFSPDGPENMTLMYYSAQISLRKILNDVHRELYSHKHHYQPSQDKQDNVSWAGRTATTLSKNLDAWRDALPPPLRWSDSDPPATDIVVARLRGKYYGARYIILRPFLLMAVRDMQHPPHMPHTSSQTSSPHPGSPENKVVDMYAVNTNHKLMMDYSHDQVTLLDMCRSCIHNAAQSTIAFDRVGVDESIPWEPGYDYIPERLITTNICGTLHAQFGNMLVLSAVYKSRLSYLVNRKQLDVLLSRTIRVLRRLAPNSPTLKIDATILENTQKILNGLREESMAVPVSVSSTSSFDASTPMRTK